MFVCVLVCSCASDVVPGHISAASLLLVSDHLTGMVFRSSVTCLLSIIIIFCCVICRVDLCNQANDNEEDDDEDVDTEYTQLPSSPNHLEAGANKPLRSCFPCRRWRVRGRQRFVILVSR